MIKSMTGYGKGSFSIGEESYTVEVKSLNNRFIDMKVRLPDRFYALESNVRAELKKRFLRGSFSLYVNAETTAAPELRLNMEVARAYIDAARSLAGELGVEEGVDAGYLLKVKDVFQPRREEADAEADWAALKEGLDAAFTNLGQWREKEGEALMADLMQRLAEITGYVEKIEFIVPEVVVNYRENLKAQMTKLLEEKVDETKILHEAAIFAQRSDIGEEVVRLKSHLEMFRNYLDSPEPVGKRLDFLCQEILREANTIASKANDLRLTQTVVEVKGVLEKMREQVQNVE